MLTIQFFVGNSLLILLRLFFGKKNENFSTISMEILSEVVTVLSLTIIFEISQAFFIFLDEQFFWYIFYGILLHCYLETILEAPLKFLQKTLSNYFGSASSVIPLHFLRIFFRASVLQFLWKFLHQYLSKFRRQFL